MKLRVRAERIGDNDKEEVEDADHETRREAEGSFATMSGDAERDADQRKDEAGDRKRKTFIDLSPTRAAHFWVLGFQLFE